MEKISKEDIDNNFFFKSSKNAKKSKKSKKVKKPDLSKKVFDSNFNSSENSSIITNIKNSEPKSSNFLSNSQNILNQYSGFSSKCNIKISCNSPNSKKSYKNKSNNLTPNVKYTPHFKQLKQVEFDFIDKNDTPNEKNTNKKSSKRHEKKTIESLHKQIKSEYKEILKKQTEKPVKMNNVSQKFKIADDYNEINSKKFLYEKDKCLKKINLIDEIEDEKENNDSFELTLSPTNLKKVYNPFLKGHK